MAELVTVGDMIINADRVTWVEKHQGGVTVYFDYAFSPYKTVHEADRQANKTAVLFEGTEARVLWEWLRSRSARPAEHNPQGNGSGDLATRSGSA